ncbi:hypothetical protein GCM10025867_05060 [Frondihabitans sucicola]|uniref:DUF222 domain-containing protein n=1 Tax=Frondihabitans sucicola TaxID=1268041 RepID=A0ABM8GIR3_9MICO|nr:hypothetical protein [Frondihabitans sucicola]BDZ48265.1 hypothetical protein GCM10025867_05060 [Frondihabitans sucicola]
MLISLAELALVAMRTLLDDEDSRSFEDKFADLQPRLEALDVVKVEEWMAGLGSLNEESLQLQIKPWITRLTTKGGANFIRRLLGAGHYDRLLVAAKLDGAIVGVALRRSARTFLPMAGALDEVAMMLTRDELEKIDGFSAAEHGGLMLLTQLDGLIGKLLAFDDGIPLSDLPIRADEAVSLDLDLSRLAARLRPLISEASLEKVEGVSDALSRKIRGATYALDHSPDGVSQAANSLVEFIDRLVREAFTDSEILSWADGRYPDKENKQENRERSSKRAQVRCFVYGGQTGPISPYQEVAAAGLLRARDRLQKIKHADQNTEAEKEELRIIIRAIESFFLFSFRLGWSLQDDEKIDLLRTRLQSK